MSYKVFFTIAFSCLFLSCAPLQSADYTGKLLYSSEGDLSYEELIFPEIELEDKPAPVSNPFPIDNTKNVKFWLNYFSKGNGRPHMQNYLERSGRYIDYMSDILSDEGLPTDLVYVSMAESGFSSSAVSSAGAVGYWQFMSATAKVYGLKINGLVDERRDFQLSTEAAARHLKDLYATFGDWRLAMSAYNCGAGCVSKAIKKHKTKDYWSLVKKRALPKETRTYVPKVMAMAEISRNPASYGFDQINYKEPLRYNIAEINSDLSRKYVSNYLNIPEQEFKQLNPKFKTDRIPLSQTSSIRIPKP